MINLFKHLRKRLCNIMFNCTQIKVNCSLRILLCHREDLKKKIAYLSITKHVYKRIQTMTNGYTNVFPPNIPMQAHT